MNEETKTNEVQLVVFMLGDEEFACNINNVCEVLKMVHVTPLPRSIYFVEGVINLRGEVIPVIDLRKRFGMEKIAQTEKSRIIIAEVDDRVFGIIVDSVSEVVSLPEKDIQDAPAHIAGERTELIIGVAKINDRMVIILDVERVLSSDEHSMLKTITENKKEATFN